MACPQAGGGIDAVVTIGDNSCNFVVSDTYGVPSTDPNGPNDGMNWGQISPCNVIGYSYYNNQASVGNGSCNGCHSCRIYNNFSVGDNENNDDNTSQCYPLVHYVEQEDTTFGSADVRSQDE